MNLMPVVIAETVTILALIWYGLTLGMKLHDERIRTAILRDKLRGTGQDDIA